MRRIEPRVVVGRRSPDVSSRRVTRHDESLASVELKKLFGELDPPYLHRQQIASAILSERDTDLKVFGQHDVESLPPNAGP